MTPTGANPAPRDEATVAAADIARIAGVGRAAVSNWRRRFPDFPAPVGGSAASPLFSLAEVETWLARSGRTFDVRPDDRIWQQIRGSVDDLQLRDLVGWLGAFLVFLRRDRRRWATLSRGSDRELAEALPDAVATAVPESPGLAGPLDQQWIGITRAVADVSRKQPPAELFGFLFDRYAEAHSRRLPLTTGAIAELMVRLAGVARGEVLDPACGTGTILLAAHTAGAARVSGQDVDEGAVRLAVARLLLRDAPLRLEVADSLRRDAFPDVLAKSVVCNPPFGDRSWGYDELTNDPRWEYGLPPRGEPELAWVQHCLAHLEPGGHAVVMMPSAAASRRPGRRIRSNLLRSGALRAVVSLPSLVQFAAAADLWVLRRPAQGDPPPSHLLVVDAAGDLSTPEEAWRAFVADPDRPRPGTTGTVRVIDLLDEEVDVSPARYLAGPVPGPEPAEFSALRDRLLSVAAGLAGSVPDLRMVDERQSSPMTTVGELVKAGVVSVHQAPLRIRTDGGELPVLTVNDVRLGRPPSGRGVAEPGAVKVQPGDVVASIASREPVVRVIADETAVLGPRLMLFRPDPQRLDPHFLAGFLRLAGLTGSSRASVSGSRLDARRAAIPLLPLARQRPYGQAFRRLEAFEAAARETTRLADQLVRLGFAGLAGGTLQPPDGDE